MTVPGRLAHEVRVAVVLADYALGDPASKVNILGANWGITGRGPEGVTPQQSLVVLLEVPSRHSGEQFAVSITLVDSGGAPVQVPGPMGELQPLRMQQLVLADRPQITGVHLPPEVPSKTQVVLGLVGGLPIEPGLYTWRVEIDGNSNPQWETSFYVVGPPPGPVFGGPAGPADIPNITPPRS